MGEKQYLSVAMCTYNGAQYLQEQLNSIATQSYLPDELVVCDDGSTDMTLEILREFAECVKFPVRIRRNARRLGAAKNFEQAISLCRGEIIVLADQDDVWRHDKLQILEHVLSENPDAGYAFSDAIIINETGKFIHSSLWKRVFFDKQRRTIFSQGPRDQVRVLLRGNVVTGATMAFRAQLKSMILPVPELWLHDEWIALVSSMIGARGIPIQEPLIYYRQHEAQVAGVPPSLLKTVLRKAWEFLLGGPKAYESYKLRLCKCNNAYIPLKARLVKISTSSLDLLENRVAHEVFRAKLCCQPRLARIGPIIAELARRQYHLYSLEWKSAIKDLLIPAVRDSLDA